MNIRGEFHKHRKISQFEAGLSLVSVLVGLAVISILSIVLNQFVTNSLNTARMISQIEELEDLRRIIRIRLNCAETLDAISKLPKKGKKLTYPLMAANGLPIAQKTSDFVYKLGQKVEFKATGFDNKTGALTIFAKGSGANDFKDLFSNGAPVVCN